MGADAGELASQWTDSVRAGARNFSGVANELRLDASGPDR